MKKIVQLAAGTTLALAIAATASAEPTRGFVIEHGNVATNGSLSIDLQSQLERAGVRVGLDFGEVILNSGRVDTNKLKGNGNDVLVKVALPQLSGLSELKHSWAVYGGLSYYDNDSPATDADDYFNFVAGVAFTGEIEQFSFTIAPELLVDDVINETYANLNLGAYFDLGETRYGTFKPGVEVVIPTLSELDTGVALGVKWGINERVSVDVVPFTFGDSDVVSLPGQLRLNAKF